jgi:hypothetical protein
VGAFNGAIGTHAMHKLLLGMLANGQVTTVPEPGTLVLFSIGLLIVAVILRRRSRSTRK